MVLSIISDQSWGVPLVFTKKKKRKKPTLYPVKQHLQIQGFNLQLLMF